MTIATTESVADGVAVEHGKVLSYLGLNPSDPKSQAVVAVAQRYALDPLLKHVIVIPKGGVYVTRDGLLHVAHRSGQLDGIVVDQEPTLSEDGREWVSRVSVYRKDMRHPFTFPGRYPVAGMNREYAQEMSLKAAESHALRRAFDVSGLPAIDEQRPEQSARTTGGLGDVLAEPTSQTTVEQVEPERIALDPDALDPTSNLAKAMFASLADAGISDRDDRLAYVSATVGRAVSSSAEMTNDDARLVLDALQKLADSEQQGGAS